LHESFVKSPIDSTKLNHEGNGGMFVVFFDLFILLSLEDFDANVFAFTFDFLNVCSHEVDVTFDHIDHNNSEPTTFGFDIVEGVKCECHVKKPLSKSCFLDIDKRKRWKM
jgi:hypothetical protein